MFKKKRSVVSVGARLTGQVETDGILELKGVVEGAVRASQVHILPSAKVLGPVEADRIVVNGTVHGPIKGKAVLVRSQALITGDINCGSLVVEKGASIEGQLKRGFGASASDIEKKDRRVEEISAARASERDALSRRERMTLLAEKTAEIGYANGHDKLQSNIKGLPISAK